MRNYDLGSRTAHASDLGRRLEAHCDRVCFADILPRRRNGGDSLVATERSDATVFRQGGHAMRYRKNIDCLSTDELHDLREALAAMYALPASDPNSFATIASFHGGPPIAYCSHGAPGFFTWHRAYLMAFENALRV